VSEDIRPVPFAPGYFVSAEGVVYSEMRGKRRALRTSKAHGYQHVTVRIDGEPRSMTVHRIVCRTFHGEPRDGQQVRHLDGTRDNNRATNLAWGTLVENMADKRVHGTALLGSKNPRARITEDAVRSIRARAAVGEGQTDIAADLGIPAVTVSQIVCGDTWAHVEMPDMSWRRTRHGERHIFAKLTESQVREIRALAAHGAKPTALGRKFSVTPFTIRCIRDGRTWKHLLEDS
jgi:hypothetical protein